MTYNRKLFVEPDAPLQLFVKLPDGTMKEQNHHACAHCHTIASHKEYAYNCCRQYLCDCGEPRPRYIGMCDACRDKETKASDVVVTNYKGPLYNEIGDCFHMDEDEYLDWAANVEELPEYLYCCTVRRLKDEHAEQIVDNLLENLLDEYHEDAHEQVNDEQGLVTAVQAWLREQTLESYQADMSRKVLAPLPEKDEESI